MTYPGRKARRCLDEWVDGPTSITQLAARTKFQHAIDIFRFESRFQTDNGLTQGVVDRWVRAAFFELFAALGLCRFDGESPPAHLPLTRADSHLLRP